MLVGKSEESTRALEDLALTEVHLHFDELIAIVAVLGQRERWATLQVIYQQSLPLAERFHRPRAHSAKADAADPTYVFTDQQKASMASADAYSLRSAIITACVLSHSDEARGFLDRVVATELSDLRQDALMYANIW